MNTILLVLCNALSCFIISTILFQFMNGKYLFLDADVEIQKLKKISETGGRILSYGFEFTQWNICKW